MKAQKDAHEVALEWLKQLITLSSGIIAFSVTFGPSITDGMSGMRWPLVLLGFSWLLFVVVIILSLDVISAITYSRIHNDDSWAEGRRKTTALVAKLCFIAGIVVFVAFAVTSVYITQLAGPQS